MDQLIIKLDDSERLALAANSFEVTIDQTPVPFVTVDDKLIISQDIHAGLHVLRIKLTANVPLVIVDLKLNDVSMRSSLYLSWIESNDHKYQPGTTFSEANQVWVMPFSNPLSLWLTLAYERTTEKEFKHGNNLYEHYDIFYPEPTEIGDKFPRFLQDFFKYDFNYTVVKRDAEYLMNVPYKSVNLGEAENQVSDVYDEVVANYEYLLGMQLPLDQHTYNSIEDQNYADNQWTIHHFRTIDEAASTTYWNEHIAKLPKLKQLIDSLEIDDLYYAFIGITKPYAYVAPHVDSPVKFSKLFDPYAGCAQLNIPLTPNDKSLFKIANVGVLPPGAWVVNNSEYAHAVVNNQDCLRVALCLRFNKDKNLKFFV